MDEKKFLELCRKYFGFLTEKFGFREGNKESSGWGHILFFENGTTAVRVSLEWEYPGVFVQLYRLINSKIVENPIIIRQDAKLTNYSLDDLLSIRSPDLGLSPILDRWQTFQNPGEIEAKIEQYALALETYATDVLQGDFTIFAELDKIVKRRAQELA